MYQRGNPQLRIFLPNFWLKLVQPEYKQPKNIVQFQCSMEMSRYDVANYLKKIYNVKPIEVRTRIALGKIKQLHGNQYVIKDDDVKIAYVVLVSKLKNLKTLILLKIKSIRIMYLDKNFLL